MKYYLSILIIVFWGHISPLYSQNSCGDGRKIITNPDNPINEREDPGPYKKLNRDLFDWRVQYYPIYCNSPYHQNYDFILSPLWDNDAYYNYIYKQFRPEDGWELIREKRGYVSETDRGDERKLAPDAILWVVLYNRYNGILRVFVSAKQYQDYSGARVSIKFRNTEGNFKTNLLRNPDDSKPLIALDEFIENQQLAAVSKYQNNPNRWLFTDFQMVYDPCTCLYESVIEINVDMIDEAIVNLTGIIEGRLFDISNRNQGDGILDNRGQKSFGINNIEEVSNRAYQSYKNIQTYSGSIEESLNALKREEAELISGVDLSYLLTEEELEEWIDDYIQSGVAWEDMLNMRDRISEQKTGLEKFAANLAEWDFLRDGLKALPWIGAAFSVLDFFTGGGQEKDGAQTVKLSPTGLEATVKLEGTVRKEFQYDDIFLNVPGCNNTNLIEENTAIYDQVLGTFNLLKTPIVEYFNNRALEIWPPFDDPPYIMRDDLRFMLHEPIEYVINPAVFKQENVEVFAAFIFEFDEPIKYKPIGEDLDDILVRESLTQYRTRFISLECLSEVRVIFRSNEYHWFSSLNPPPQIPVPRVFLKLIVNLERLDKTPSQNIQNVLFVGKFPVNLYVLDEHLGWDEKWESLSLGIPRTVELENTIIDRDYSAWETITIGSNVTTQSGSYKLTAGKKILSENSVFDPNIILQIGLPFECNAEKYGPITDVTNFCQSNQTNGYKPLSRSKIRADDFNTQHKSNELSISLSPNPASDYIEINLDRWTPPDRWSPSYIKIYNTLGECVISDVRHLRDVGHLNRIDVSHLPSGVYFVRFNNKALPFVKY